MAVRHIYSHGKRPTPKRLDLARSLIDYTARSGGKADVRSGLRQRDREITSHRRPDAGDDRDLALQAEAVNA